MRSGKPIDLAQARRVKERKALEARMQRAFAQRKLLSDHHEKISGAQHKLVMEYRKQSCVDVEFNQDQYQRLLEETQRALLCSQYERRETEKDANHLADLCDEPVQILKLPIEEQPDKIGRWVVKVSSDRTVSKHKTKTTASDPESPQLMLFA